MTHSALPYLVTFALLLVVLACIGLILWVLKKLSSADKALGEAMRRHDELLGPNEDGE